MVIPRLTTVQCPRCGMIRRTHKDMEESETVGHMIDCGLPPMPIRNWVLAYLNWTEQDETLVLW